MAMAKLNVFHWHMTDSQSFPLVLKSHPDLSAIGAYSPDKIYTIKDVTDVRWQAFLFPFEDMQYAYDLIIYLFIHLAV